MKPLFLLFAIFPVLAGADDSLQLFELDITAFDKPNSQSYGWTEAGIGTATLTYTHETGVTVILKAEPKDAVALVRTYVKGTGAVGINDPMIESREILAVEIGGIQGSALVRQLSFVGLTRNETFRLVCPGLVYFQANGGSISSLADNFVRHDEETGSTALAGGNSDPGAISGVKYALDDASAQATGFRISPKHQIRMRAVGQNSDAAFVGLTFYAVPE